MTQVTANPALVRQSLINWLRALLARRPTAPRTSRYEDKCIRAKADLLEAVDNGFQIDGGDAVARLPRHAHAYVRTIVQTNMMI